MTKFLGFYPTPLISTFLYTTTGTPVSTSNWQAEITLNLQTLQNCISDLHLIVLYHLEERRRKSWQSTCRDQLCYFDDSDYVLLSRKEFTANQKRAFCWPDPCRICKCLSDYIYRIADLRTGQVDNVHISRVKFCHDANLDQKSIMLNVLSSKTVSAVARLIILVEDKGGSLKVQVRWTDLPGPEDTLEASKRSGITKRASPVLSLLSPRDDPSLVLRRVFEPPATFVVPRFCNY